jgi:hypothetical protein
MGGALYFLGGVLFVPILLARYVLRASWQTIGVAYAIWFGFLVFAMLLHAPSGLFDEAAGWAMILAFFLSIPVVCGLVLVIGLVNLLRNRRPRFGRT